MITEIYSKRQKRLRGEFPDVYQYETVPENLRVKIQYIWDDLWQEFDDNEVAQEIIGNYYKDLDDGICNDMADGDDIVVSPYRILSLIEHTLLRKYGLKSLSGSEFPILHDGEYPFRRVWKFFHETRDTEKVIDVIQLLFQYLDTNTTRLSDHDELRAIYNEYREEAILKLNTYFREHGVGYQYESGQIIRVDSQYIYSKAVRPMLNLLSDPMYKSANEEFLKAHEHYRKGDYKSCIHECSNAFESVLKVICDNKGWEYTEKATAKPLLDIVYNNGLLPKYKKSFFDSVRGGLEHGIPVTRNKNASHGQGSQEVTVPDYMAEYMLNLTASSILLLIKASKET